MPWWVPPPLKTRALSWCCADAVIFKSSLGTGKGDFVQALQTLSEGGVYLPEEIRQLGAAEAPNPNLPPLIEELTERELEVVAGVARGLTNQGIGTVSYTHLTLPTILLV